MEFNRRWEEFSKRLPARQNAPASQNRRAAVFNERIIDANTWGTEFGIVGFC